ncbi:MAG: glutathione synthetase [Lysobacteraceae bacterium]|nr:MAG: glutathione synthetase [Xanthomonadaceae bacterium]
MSQTLNIAVIMDPISAIKIAKDSTFAMLLEAQRRGHRLWYAERGDLSLKEGRAHAHLRAVAVQDNPEHWYDFGESGDQPLASMQVVLMRKDPPFDMQYIYDTYLLEQAEREGCLIVNKPQALRDANEKLFTAFFPDLTPPTAVSRDQSVLRSFVEDRGEAILKPLDGMGGTSIFKTSSQDPNLNVILETLTENGQTPAMAQAFIPEISAGDKRILLIEGEPVPYALARIPTGKDFRGNLAKGGRGEGVALSERDYQICQAVAPELIKRGMMFVGLDVIGDYLTEVNVTSPTCIRELDALYDLNIAGQLFDAIEKRVAN